MKKTMATKALLFSTLFSLSFAHAGTKIVGGEPVTDRTEAPYIVSLSGSCGGSVISSKWVLTAAHCAGYFSTVKGGVINLKETGHSYRVKRTIKHPEYNRSTFSNDFALVELDSEIDFEATGIKPVKLASQEFADEGNTDAGVDATVYGFGNIREGGSNYTRDLNKVVVPIVSNEEANAPTAYNGDVDDTMIAAGFNSGGKDACQGDSGGPMVVFDHQNDPVQVGVVSWGIGCARPNKFGIYSRVSSAIDWIKETAGL